MNENKDIVDEIFTNMVICRSAKEDFSEIHGIFSNVTLRNGDSDIEFMVIVFFDGYQSNLMNRKYSLRVIHSKEDKEYFIDLMQVEIPNQGRVKTAAVSDQITIPYIGDGIYSVQLYESCEGDSVEPQKINQMSFLVSAK